MSPELKTEASLRWLARFTRPLASGLSWKHGERGRRRDGKEGQSADREREREDGGREGLIITRVSIHTPSTVEPL